MISLKSIVIIEQITSHPSPSGLQFTDCFLNLWQEIPFPTSSFLGLSERAISLFMAFFSLPIVSLSVYLYEEKQLLTHRVMSGWNEKLFEKPTHQRHMLWREKGRNLKDVHCDSLKGVLPFCVPMKQTSKDPQLYKSNHEIILVLWNVNTYADIYVKLHIFTHIYSH